MGFEQLRPFNKIPRLNIYQDISDNNKWRWRIWMSSDIVAASSQGYSSEGECKENLLKVEQYIKSLREQNLI